MVLLAGPTWVAALLLVVAGAHKMTRPTATVAALHAANLPSGRMLVRALGAGEVGVGLAALLVGDPLAMTVLAGSYAALAVFAWRQRQAGGHCGCFGAAESSVSSQHVAVNIVAAGAAAAAVAAPPGPLLATAADGALLAWVTVTLVVAGTTLVRVLLTSGTALADAVSLARAELPS